MEDSQVFFMIFMPLIYSNSAFRFASFNIITLQIDLHMADVNNNIFTFCNFSYIPKSLYPWKPEDN